MTTYAFRRKVALSLVITVLLMLASGFLFTPPLFAADAAATAVDAGAKSQLMWVCLSAAIAFSVGALSAGIAISNVGSAAMGAISEKPEIASQALIFIALAEGLVVFGFITALMILGKA
ncbi:MAG: ATP synthase subunit C [Sphaerochaetaceae bacterium]|nr:ATP synthase subunit C [Sphaerochaetaceae bacterium]